MVASSIPHFTSVEITQCRFRSLGHLARPRAPYIGTVHPPRAQASVAGSEAGRVRGLQAARTSCAFLLLFRVHCVYARFSSTPWKTFLRTRTFARLRSRRWAIRRFSYMSATSVGSRRRMGSGLRRLLRVGSFLLPRPCGILTSGCRNLRR